MKTKEILNDWKSFLEKETINEISIKKFKEKYPDFNTSIFSSQLRGNTDYLDIISNSINSGQSHGPDDFVQQFDFYKNSIEPNHSNQDFLTIDVPGGETVSLAGKVNKGSCTATYDDIQQFQQARMFTLGKGSKRKLTAAYEKITNESSQDDFEKIAEDSNWIIFYPKSTRGSIALARSYWDGNKITYDTTFNPSKGFGQNTGTIRWCTSVSGSGNMFLTYHRKLNLHMYYCIKKNLSSVEDVDRKLCISLSKNKNKITFAKNHASVNANNTSINQVTAQQYIGNLYDILTKDVKQQKRLEIDQESYYRSISISQYIIMREANEENIDDFLPELKGLIDYSKDSEKIVDHCIQDRRKEIREYIARDYYYLTEEQLKILLSDSDISVRENAASIVSDFYRFKIKANLPEELMLSIVKDPSENIRYRFASRMSNPSDKAIEILLNDKSLKVIRALTANRSMPQEAFINIVNKYRENAPVVRSVISNYTLSDESFRKIFDSGILPTKSKITLAIRGRTKHITLNSTNAKPRLLSKKEILDLYNETKSEGLIDFKTLQNFINSDVEEIYLDMIDFCEKNSKGNKIQVKDILVGILHYTDGVTERVISKIFSVSNDTSVMKFIARNSNTSTSILRQLLLRAEQKKNTAGIRSLIATNPNTTIEMLETLTNDSSKKVSNLAINSLKKRQKLESNLISYIKLVLS